MIINGKDLHTPFKSLFNDTAGLFTSVFKPNRTQQREASFRDKGSASRMQSGQRAYLEVQKYSGIRKVNNNNIR